MILLDTRSEFNVRLKVYRKFIDKFTVIDWRRDIKCIRQTDDDLCMKNEPSIYMIMIKEPMMGKCIDFSITW